MRFDPPIGSASVTFTLTAFPGVVIEYGHRGHAIFPRCGCDGCDEDPTEQIERLASELADILCGSFTETLTRRIGRADRYEAVLVSANGAESSSRVGKAEENDPPMPYGTFRWKPWPSGPEAIR